MQPPGLEYHLTFGGRREARWPTKSTVYQPGEDLPWR
jgi:hypothetical protein